MRRFQALASTAAAVTISAIALTAAVPATSYAQSASAAAPTVTEVAGIKYPDSIQIGAAKLVLNGAGIRYKVVFKVYTAGLYLPAKASSVEGILAEQGPKRIQIVMLREIDANELGKLFTKGMEQNAPREEFSKSIVGILKLSDIFSARKKLVAGDAFAVEWVPGTGTVITVNGKPEGQPIKEPEFYSALMRIWLGKSPADEQLKEALLGKVAANHNGGYN
jgi:hypothetical protein